MQRASELIRRSAPIAKSVSKASYGQCQAANVQTFDYLRSDDVKAVLELQESFNSRYGRSSIFTDMKPRVDGEWSL